MIPVRLEVFEKALNETGKGGRYISCSNKSVSWIVPVRKKCHHEEPEEFGNMARPLPELNTSVDPSGPAGKGLKHRTLASMLNSLPVDRDARGRLLQMHRDNSSNLTSRETRDEENEEGEEEGDAEE